MGLLMKYVIRGKGDISLTQDNFIFQGGEGKVYGKGNTVYKIYDDLKKLIPEAKIRELGMISHPNIIKPEDIILNPKGTYVGFTMVWIKNSVPLVKLFTNEFRNRNNITDDGILELIESMKEAIVAIHQSKCLMVDGNEFNYLADDKTFKIPYLIDVNSYQTPSFPATVIMPSIRDPHAKNFSELSDWYSFGIVAFQLFAGIHPYKGKHPDYNKKNMGADVLLNRMKDHISVFNPQVSVPPTTRDFACIPKNYLNWLTDVFEKGKRLAPPMTAGAAIMPTVGIRVIHSTDNFEIRLMKEFESEILYHAVVFGVEITKTKQKLHIGSSAYSVSPDTEVIFTPKKAKPVLINIENNSVRFSAIRETQGQVHAIPLECTEKMIIDNTVFLRNMGNLVELSLIDKTDGDVAVAVKSVWNIMPLSSEVFSGIVYQNVLGKPYLMIPLPKTSSCINLHVPELEGCRIVQAKHENHIIMLIVHKNHLYRRIMLKFDASYQKYDCRISDDVEYGNINFTVLDNGIVVAINEENAVEVFLNQIGNDRIDVIKDPDIQYSLKLCKDGIITKFFKDNGLYSIRRVKK